MVAGLLGVVAIVALTAATVAVWARATVSDGEEVAGIVDDALAEPDVADALTTYVSRQVLAAVGADAAISGVLPDQLQRLEGVITSGAQSAIERGVARLLANPDVRVVLAALVEHAHGRAMRLLRGDGLVDGVSVTDGAVTLNLLPLIGRGIARAQELGVFAQMDVPELTADGDPGDQIAQLEAATGRDLPDDFGQLVVYRSDRIADRHDSLQRAQQTLALATRAMWALVIAAILATGASVLVALDRGRAVLWLGLGGVAAMVVTRAAVRRVVEDAPDVATDPGARAAISTIVGNISTGLLRVAAVVLIVAAGAAGFALFRRRWRRSDLVAVGAVLAFVVVVAVGGISLVSLVLGLVIAGLVPVVVGKLA